MTVLLRIILVAEWAFIATVVAIAALQARLWYVYWRDRFEEDPERISTFFDFPPPF